LVGYRKTNQVFAQSVSPIHYVKTSTPPTFLIHGDADSTVSQKHSIRLYQKLQEAGVVSEFMSIPGGGHGKFTKEQNAEINLAIMKFIKALKPFKK